MSIGTVVTRGYGPSASIAFVVRRGYSASAVVAATAAPGPLMLSPKMHRALMAKRRKAEEELAAARRGEEERRAKLRATIGRALRGEAEPVEAAEPPAGEAAAPVVREVRKVAPPEPVIPADPQVEAKLAALGRQIDELKARIAAHEEAEEDDDIETLMLLVA